MSSVPVLQQLQTQKVLLLLFFSFFLHKQRGWNLFLSLIFCFILDPVMIDAKFGEGVGYSSSTKLFQEIQRRMSPCIPEGRKGNLAIRRSHSCCD